MPKLPKYFERIKATELENLRTEALASRGLIGSPKYITKHSNIVEVDELSTSDSDSLEESRANFQRSRKFNCRRQSMSNSNLPRKFKSER